MKVGDIVKVREDAKSLSTKRWVEHHGWLWVITKLDVHGSNSFHAKSLATGDEKDADGRFMWFYSLEVEVADESR